MRIQGIEIKGIKKAVGDFNKSICCRMYFDKNRSEVFVYDYVSLNDWTVWHEGEDITCINSKSNLYPTRTTMQEVKDLVDRVLTGKSLHDDF